MRNGVFARVARSSHLPAVIKLNRQSCTTFTKRCAMNKPSIAAARVADRRWSWSPVYLGPLLAVALWAFHADPQSLASAAELETRAWKKMGAAEPSYFINQGQGRWIEVQEDGKRFRFEETSNRRGRVELLDRGRRIKIRLRDDYAELSQNEQPLRRWVNGAWTPASELPEYAQVAPIDHRLRLIYFVPADREPTANYEAKIRTLMTFVNGVYQEEFRRRHWPDQGLQFEENDSGEPIVHLIHGKHDAAYYSGAPNYDFHLQYRRLQEEVPASIGAPQTHLMVAFLETYDSGPHKFEWPGGVALGGRFSADGGLGIFSSWILRDEFCATSVAEQQKLFQDETSIEGRTAHGHGGKNSPRFEFIEDGFGAVIHEVGHALGLPHDQRDDRHYIMGNGFRILRNNFDPQIPWDKKARFSDDNARILAASRHLNPQADLSDHEPPVAKVTLSVTDKPGIYRLELKATDNKALAAVLLFDEAIQSVTGGSAIEGTEAEQTFDVVLKPDEASQQVKLRVDVVDQGGQSATARLSLKLPAPAES